MVPVWGLVSALLASPIDAGEGPACFAVDVYRSVPYR